MPQSDVRPESVFPRPLERGAGRLRILVAAEESAGIRLLRALAETNHHVVGVLSSAGAENAATASVGALAARMGLPHWPAECVRDRAFAKTVRSLDADLLLNVHALHVIRPEILSAVRFGGFNMHPGPLPRLAGLNAPSWALFRGETTHAVTVHKMEREIDAGSIVYQTAFDIGETDSALTVSAKCVTHGLPLLLRLVDTVARNPEGLPLHAMDRARREYKGREVPNDGWLSWSWTARQVVNFVRACDYHPFPSPWGQPRTRLGQQEIGIAKALRTGRAAGAAPGTVLADGDRNPLVACADEAVEVTHVKVADRVYPASKFLVSDQRMEP